MDFEGAFFDTKNFILLEDKELGEGSFGKVYIVQRKTDNMEFAAKIINYKGMMNGTDQLKFLRESQILNKLNHPAIVKFHGINFHSFKEPSKLEPTILTEYVCNGSLKSILEKEKEKQCDPQWTPTKKYICLLGIADAMRYLHENRVLHRDLKSLNVLLDDQFYPRVCDFGLSRCFSQDIINSNELVMTEFVGTPLYMAPELFDDDSIYGGSVDVYSFAILAYEIVTGQVPYSHLQKVPSFYKLAEKVKSGERPKFNSNVTDKMKNLIEKCWSVHPYERPSFREIYDKLSTDFTYVKKEELNETEIKMYIKKLNDANQKVLIDSNQRLSSLLYDMDQLKVVQEIAKGSVGSFFKAVHVKTSTEYTLKFVKKIQTLKGQRNFLESIELQSQMKHDAVLQLVGFSLPINASDGYKVVTEFAPNGSLEKLIVRAKSGPLPPNYHTVVAMNIFGVACAMAFIHQHDVCLADLRPESVLLDDHNRPKIGGFVNSFFLKNGESCHNSVAFNGILNYMAPEILVDDHAPFGNKIDVYAFGALLFRVLTMRVPYCEYPGAFKSEAFFQEVREGKRPTIKKGEMSEGFEELIGMCWASDPISRPSFIQIVQMMLSEPDKYFEMEKIDRNEFEEYVELVTKKLEFW